MAPASRRTSWIVLAVGAAGAACGTGAAVGGQKPVADAAADAGVSLSELDAGTMSASAVYVAIAGSCVYWSTLDGIYSAEKTYTPADAGFFDSALPDSGNED